MCSWYYRTHLKLINLLKKEASDDKIILCYDLLTIVNEKKTSQDFLATLKRMFPQVHGELFCMSKSFVCYPSQEVLIGKVYS